MPGMQMPAAGVTAPPAAPAPAAALPDPAATAGWPSPVDDNALKSFLLFDLLEFQHAPKVEAARWDILGWYGGDTERIWFKSEGRYNGVLRAGEMDVQFLYGRLISPFVDFQAGFRWEQQLSRDNNLGRPQAVLGVQGLVPYGLELDAAIFVSQLGDLSTRVTLAQDFLLTQRLILQPRVELNAALQSAVEYGVGAGLNDIEISLRLRYEIIREFAPYIGVSLLQSFGETASLRSAAGENSSIFQLVAGFRMWF
jgi:copper resistance protein B